MALLLELINVLLHLDKYLLQMVSSVGNWIYGIMFAIIFCETGLVVTPFLPGDSLLFAAGALAAIDILNLWILWLVLVAAAILGDTVNYWVGSYFGDKFFTEKSLVFKKEYLDRTHKYFEKYGNNTIILARFVPIVRTFAPFLAGVGKMTYLRFLAYNIVGAVLWVSLFLFGGYYFGNLPFVQENFGMVVIGVIIVSLIPLIIEFFKYRNESKKPAKK